MVDYINKLLSELDDFYNGISTATTPAAKSSFHNTDKGRETQEGAVRQVSHHNGQIAFFLPCDLVQTFSLPSHSTPQGSVVLTLTTNTS
jgi:hypothetical protein